MAKQNYLHEKSLVDFTLAEASMKNARQSQHFLGIFVIKMYEQYDLKLSHGL